MLTADIDFPSVASQNNSKCVVDAHSVTGDQCISFFPKLSPKYRKEELGYKAKHVAKELPRKQLLVWYTKE